MATLNSILGAIFDAVLYPFRGLDPMVGLGVVSVAASIGMLLGYKATSNQPAVEAVKRRISAGLFEIRLFNDDLVAILRAQGAILRYNLKYLALNMVPMVFMLVPFVLLVAQLQFHYGYEGLRPGDTTTLRVGFATEATALGPGARLEVPAGLSIDSERVWIPSLNEAAWRVRVEQPGTYEMAITAGSDTLTKSLVAGETIERRSPARLAPGLLNQILYPAEPPLPAGSPITSIRIDYPERAVGLFGFETHWLIVFFVLTIALAFALKGRFGVTI